jgi:hypothetical protein
MSKLVDGPPGTVAVVFSSDAARFSAFTADLGWLELPAGTELDFAFGEDTATLHNDLVSKALKRGLYWVWFINEDHTFAPGTIASLLSRDEAIVAPIVLERKKPFYPHAYTDVGGEPVRFLLNAVAGPGTMHEVARLTSSAGVLIRRAVFEALDPPWFNDGDDLSDLCRRAMEIGIQPFVDTSVRLGNRLIGSFYPRYRGGKWELVAVVGAAEFDLPIRHP